MVPLQLKGPLKPLITHIISFRTLKYKKVIFTSDTLFKAIDYLDIFYFFNQIHVMVLHEYLFGLLLVEKK